MNNQITQRKTGVAADRFPFKLWQILGNTFAGKPGNRFFLATKAVDQLILQRLTTGKDCAIGQS